jgi:hypothetical protein
MRVWVRMYLFRLFQWLHCVPCAEAYCEICEKYITKDVVEPYCGCTTYCLSCWFEQFDHIFELIEHRIYTKVGETYREFMQPAYTVVSAKPIISCPYCSATLGITDF